MPYLPAALLCAQKGTCSTPVGHCSDDWVHSGHTRLTAQSTGLALWAVREIEYGAPRTLAGAWSPLDIIGPKHMEPVPEITGGKDEDA